MGSFKNCNCSRENRLQNQFASQMWAARPHLASIFEKLLEQKTFCLPAARYLETMLLKKTVFRVRQKGVPPLLLPTSVLQLPRCLVWICNLDSHDTTLFELDNFKTCNCSWKTWFQNHICFANVGCSPTPRQHFWKIAGAKNFLFACGSIFGNDASKENGLSRPAKGGSTPAFAYQRAAIAPLPCLNLQPWFSWYNFVWIGQFQKCNCSRKTKLQNPICFANVGCSPTPRQHF